MQSLLLFLKLTAIRLLSIDYYENYKRITTLAFLNCFKICFLENTCLRVNDFDCFKKIQRVNSFRDLFILFASERLQS